MRQKTVAFIVVYFLWAAAIALFSLAFFGRGSKNNTVRVANGATQDPAANPVASSHGKAPVEGAESSAMVSSTQKSPARASFRNPNRRFPDASSQRINESRYRVIVRNRFGHLYKKLGLTPEQVERFESEAAASFPEINIWANPIVAPDRERDLLSVQLERLNSVIGSTIGADKCEAFMEHLKQSDLQQVVDNLSVNAVYAAGPLSQDQTDRLLALCAKYRPQQDAIRIDVSQIPWDAVLNEARAILSPSQLTIFQDMTTIMTFDRTFKQATGLQLRRPVRGI